MYDYYELNLYHSHLINLIIIILILLILIILIIITLFYNFNLLLINLT
jgi:hypothetical protein